MSRQLNRIRDHEAAQIARWFRDTDYGLVYHHTDGRAYPITERERERWQRRALRQLETFLARLDRLPFETLLIAFGLIAAAYAVNGLFDDRIPLLGTFPPFAALPALLWPWLSSWQWQRQRRALRQEIADRLVLRTPLPEAEAIAARRYNVFQIGAVSLGVVILAIGAVGAFTNQPRFGFVPILILAAIAYPLHFAGQRVDAAHRRKL